MHIYRYGLEKSKCTVHVKSLSVLLCVAFQSAHQHPLSQQQQQSSSEQSGQHLVLQQQQKSIADALRSTNDFVKK